MNVDSLAPSSGGMGAPHCPVRVGSQAGVSQRLCPPHAVSVVGHVQVGLHILVQQHGTSGGQGLQWCPNLPKAHICLLFPCPPAAGALPVCPSPVTSASYSGKWVLSFQQRLLPPRLTPAASVARAPGSAASTLSL